MEANTSPAPLPSCPESPSISPLKAEKLTGSKTPSGQSSFTSNFGSSLIWSAFDGNIFANSLPSIISTSLFTSISLVS